MRVGCDDHVAGRDDVIAALDAEFTATACDLPWWCGQRWFKVVVVDEEAAELLEGTGCTANLIERGPGNG